MLSPLEPALRPNRSGWATEGWISFQGPPWRGCQGGLQRVPCCISYHVEMLGEAGRIPGSEPLMEVLCLLLAPLWQ